MSFYLTFNLKKNLLSPDGRFEIELYDSKFKTFFLSYKGHLVISRKKRTQSILNFAQKKRKEIPAIHLRHFVHCTSYWSIFDVFNFLQHCHQPRKSIQFPSNWIGFTQELFYSFVFHLTSWIFNRPAMKEKKKEMPMKTSTRERLLANNYRFRLYCFIKITAIFNTFIKKRTIAQYFWLYKNLTFCIIGIIFHVYVEEHFILPSPLKHIFLRHIQLRIEIKKDALKPGLQWTGNLLVLR